MNIKFLGTLFSVSSITFGLIAYNNRYRRKTHQISVFIKSVEKCKHHKFSVFSERRNFQKLENCASHKFSNFMQSFRKLEPNVKVANPNVKGTKRMLTLQNLIGRCSYSKILGDVHTLRFLKLIPVELCYSPIIFPFAQNISELCVRAFYERD